MISANRITPLERQVVAPNTQDGIALLRHRPLLLDDVRELDSELLRATLASKYDPHALEAALTKQWPDVHARPRPGFLFNDTRGLEASTEAYLVQPSPSECSVTVVAGYPHHDCTLFAAVSRGTEGFQLDFLVDTAVFSVDQAAHMLRDVRDILLSAQSLSPSTHPPLVGASDA